MQYMKKIIDEVAAKERIKTAQNVLKIDADFYKMISQTEKLLLQYPGTVSPKEKKIFDREITEIKEMLDGNVD